MQTTATAARDTLREGLDLLLPPTCTFCSREITLRSDGILLCGRCRRELVNVAGAMCMKCGCALPASQTQPAADCANCRPLSFRFSEVIALSGYRGDLRRAVLKIKNSDGYPLAVSLGQLLAQQRVDRFKQFNPDVITAIPMHWMRRLRRGTNCAETISEQLTRELDCAWEPGLLVRRQNTRRQADLAPGNRRRNVRRAFHAASGYDLNGLRVVVVDDILTTGATGDEAARALLDAGAAQVAIAILARAIPWT